MLYSGKIIPFQMLSRLPDVNKSDRIPHQPITQVLSILNNPILTIPSAFPELRTYCCFGRIVFIN